MTLDDQIQAWQRALIEQPDDEDLRELLARALLRAGCLPEGTIALVGERLLFQRGPLRRWLKDGLRTQSHESGDSWQSYEAEYWALPGLRVIRLNTVFETARGSREQSSTFYLSSDEGWSWTLEPFDDERLGDSPALAQARTPV